MCVDSIRKIISFSKTIRDRRSCTEQDVVYHFVAPLMECLGYSKEELYFEWGQGSPIPDITVIHDNSDHPLLTVEVKRNWDNVLDSLQVKDVYIFERSHTRHNNVIEQVFSQLKIPRKNDYPYALLTNGNNVALFTFLKCGCQSRYHMCCIYASSFNEILKDQNRIGLLVNHLHRDAIIGKNDYLINKIRSLDTLATIQSQKTIIYTRRASIELPDDWDNQFRSWSNKFSQISNEFNVFKSLVDRDDMTLEQKMSLFEIMRFCNLMQNCMPKDWELRFKVGKPRNGGNIFVQLYPKFSKTELQGNAFFLYKIAATGRRDLGCIWFRIQNKKDFDKNNPIQILNDIKSNMAIRFHSSVRIYMKGIVEDLIEATSIAAIEMFKEGLTESTATLIEPSAEQGGSSIQHEPFPDVEIP